MARIAFEDLLGKTLKECKQVGHDEIHFILENGDGYKLHHYQDCCESVTIEDVNGNLDDLVGSPITMAQETIDSGECYTYTFYKLATAKGFVDIRWNGESNGYYSESVDFDKI